MKRTLDTTGGAEAPPLQKERSYTMKYEVISEDNWVKGSYDTMEEAQAHVDLLATIGKHYHIEIVDYDAIFGEEA